jgi:hypothetical protein
MKERPITFTAAKVRAILDGRKTQFRRMVKPQPAEGLAWRGAISCSTVKADEGKHLFTDRYPCARQAQRISCPFGNPRNGDRLRIKDTRIILANESVRAERLQDITEEDATAEGITDGGCLSCGMPEPCGCKNPRPDRRDEIAQLWGDLWHENPWVWVVEFRVVEGGQND